MPGILGAGMQTIVHTPHGIQTMVPQGPQLTSISQTVAPTTVRPVTIATSSGSGNSSTGKSKSRPHYFKIFEFSRQKKVYIFCHLNRKCAKKGLTI